MLQCAIHAEIELVLFKRFEDVVVGSTPNRFECRRDIVNGRDHDHRHFWIILAKPVEQLDAVHFRHDHVAQDQIRGGTFHLILCGAAVANRGAAVAFRLQHRGDNFANGLFVVDDQNVFDGIGLHFARLPFPLYERSHGHRSTVAH